MRLSDDLLRGRTVIAGDGVAVGEIVLLFLDGGARRVESIKVRLRKDAADRLGADRSLFRAGVAEIPIELVQSIGDAVVLTVGLDELRHVLPRSEVAPEHAPPH